MKAEDAHKVLNLAADIFAASPIHTFKREDVVKTLRDLGDEIEYQAMLNAAGEIPGPERMS